MALCIAKYFSGNDKSCIKQKYNYILSGFPLSVRCVTVNYNIKLHGINNEYSRQLLDILFSKQKIRSAAALCLLLQMSFAKLHLTDIRVKASGRNQPKIFCTKKAQ